MSVGSILGYWASNVNWASYFSIFPDSPICPKDCELGTGENCSYYVSNCYSLKVTFYLGGIISVLVTALVLLNSAISTTDGTFNRPWGLVVRKAWDSVATGLMPWKSDSLPRGTGTFFKNV
jgi:hypothetical protein